MYERTLKSALRYLATVPHHTVPMKDLWSAVTREARASKIEECGLPDFAALLEADIRFTVLENGYHPEDIDFDDMDDERRAMFDLGFAPNCLVTLRLDLESDDGEEMPSIVHKHLSETKPAKVVHERSAAKRSPQRSRQKRGSSTSTKKQGARRRHK